MSDKKAKSKKTKKVTLFVSSHGMVSLEEDFDPYIQVCQDVLDKFGVKSNRRDLQEDVITKVVLSVESVDHGECFNWIKWEKFKTKS